VQDAVHINAKTIRHIVGVPNHIRAWTRKAYFEAGGYSSLHVADDYELLVRLFLTTRFVLVPKLCYIQFYNTASIGNTQQTRNKEIQRVVRFVSGQYDRRIHERLVELGVDDFVWNEKIGFPCPGIIRQCRAESTPRAFRAQQHRDITRLSAITHD